MCKSYFIKSSGVVLLCLLCFNFANANWNQWTKEAKKMDGEYVLNFALSSPNCPQTAKISADNPIVFNTNLFPNETVFQIVGADYYPRTGEWLYAGYFKKGRYFQNRYRRDKDGLHSILMTSFEAFLNKNGQLQANMNKRTKPNLDEPMKPFYQCVFDRS